jgi:UDP-2,3-diacylglucosamine pyrophosphatase LpxH
MEFPYHILQLKDPTKWTYLYFLSDVHLGAQGCNTKLFREKIREIADNDRAYWFGIGDIGDFIFYSDPRFVPQKKDIDEKIDSIDVVIRNAMQVQIRKIVAELEPIKDKCLGYGSGNHEEKCVRFYHTDPTIEVANRLGIKYMGYSAMATLLLRPASPNRGKTESLRIYMHHGHGGGRTHGAQINKVEQFVMGNEADIYAMGHVHGKIASKTNRLYTTNTGNPYMRPKAYVVTSSYQHAATKGSTTYAERMAFRESELAAPVVKFRFKGKRHLLDIKVIV